MTWRTHDVSYVTGLFVGCRVTGSRIEHPIVMPTFFSGGKPIRIDQHEPKTSGPHPAILLLHGSGGNIGLWSDKIAPYVTGRGISLYAAHYFESTGTDRADYDTIIDGVHFPAWLATVADALAWMRTQPRVDPDRIALIGISLGGFLALSLATDPAANIRAIVELSGGLPDPYRAMATPTFPPTLIFHGADDTYVTVSDAEKLIARLKELKVVHEAHIFRGQGHFFSGTTQLQILMTTANFLSKYL
ncbi:MAG: dienelactone hydrolase family protein [Acidobacteriota bacterium]|nr:dienelactone hydrolase family protein [Acidobacteriota bacterium]